MNLLRIGIATAFFLGSVVSILFLTPVDGYGCHLGVKHVGGGASCGGGGGGDDADVATNDTDARWSGFEINDLDRRSCFLEFASNDGKAGHYKCDQTDLVDFMLPGGSEVDKKGQPLDPQPVDTICSKFTGISMTPNTNYAYDWTGLCTTDVGCDVRVLNWFFEDPERPRKDETGLIILEGFGQIKNAGNLNPFAESQTVPIDEVLITIKGNGTNKTVAICRYDMLGVTFTSEPE